MQPRRSRPFVMLTALFWAVLSTSIAVAQEQQAESELVLQVDNDEFASFNKKDRWYTSGIKASRVRQAIPGSGRWARTTARLCARVDADQATDQTTHTGFGQNIYTQSVRSRQVPEPDDRPIAAYLFMETGATIGDDWGQGALSAEFGLTGPGALGEEIQNAVHGILNQTRVPAWSYQLRPRFGANLHLTCTQRWPQTGVDWLTGYSASVGTMLDEVSVGIALTAGPGRLAAGFPLEARLAVPTIRKSRGWSFIAGARARWVAYDALLDGQTYRYRSEVSSRALVGEAFIGLSVNLVSDWQLKYMLIQRTAEFDGPGVAQKNYRPQLFGTLTLHIPI